MLIVENLQKSFHKKPIFEPINLEARQGSITLIMGENGVGKTSLLKCLSGHLKFEMGQVDFVEEENKMELHKVAGLCLSQENSFFPQLTLHQNIQFFKKFFQSKVDTETLSKELQIKPWMDKKFQECSSGVKRRMGILRSFLCNPRLLLIDEPFNSMDLKFCEDLGTFITHKTKELQLITLIASNQLPPKTLMIQKFIEVKKC